MPLLSRRLSAYRVSALLFLLLGVGNIAVGRSRGTYYAQKTAEFKVQVQDPSQKDLAYLKTLTNQESFYSLVQRGGLFFLLIAAAILVTERAKSR